MYSPLVLCLLKISTTPLAVTTFSYLIFAMLLLGNEDSLSSSTYWGEGVRGADREG